MESGIDFIIAKHYNIFERFQKHKEEFGFMGKISIKDVAKLAGVAVSTASMALNNNNKIKEETRKRLQNAAKLLGYIPNRAAQSLVGKKTNSIGIVIPSMSNSIYLEEAFSVKNYTDSCNYKTRIFIANLCNPEEREHLLCTVLGNVDGLICYPLPSESGDYIQESLRSYDIKYIYNKFTNETNADWVSVDYEKGGFLAADYLLKKGHRNIGIFTLESNYISFPERENGFRRAFEKHGRPFNECRSFTCDVKGDISEGYESAKKILMLKPRPTALFMRADYLAIGALKAANDLGLRAGKDVDIVGFDNIAQGEFTVPALTTVGYDKKRKAKIMLDTLLKRIKEDDSPPINIFLEPELVIRESA